MSAPTLRFIEFTENWQLNNLLSLSENGFTNGVFNDPAKVGSGYKLVNVLDMYIETTIDETRLKLIELDKAEFIKNKVEYGDIFFTRSSLVKEGIAYSNTYLGKSEDITFDGHLIRMRPIKNLLNSSFLNYLLKTATPRSQLVKRGKTPTMTTIGQADIAEVEIKFPSKFEQTKIANFLTAVDKKITHLNQKHDLLTFYKKGVMQQIFSQELRFKDENGQGFPEWEESKLGEISSFFSGGTPLTTKNDYYGGEIPFIKSGEISANKTAQFISESGLKNSSAKMVLNGDLLYALYGATSGEVAVSKIEGAINQAVLCIRSKLDTYFLLSYFLFEKKISYKPICKAGKEIYQQKLSSH